MKVNGYEWLKTGCHAASAGREYLDWIVFDGDVKMNVQQWNALMFSNFMVNITGTTSVFPIDLSRYPHKCRRCQAPAYVGANLVDCSSGCK